MFTRYFRNGLRKFQKILNDHRVERLDGFKLGPRIQVDTYNYFENNDGFHEMNIYRLNDVDTKDLPLIIYIHGGAWVSGDKDSEHEFCETMCLRNFNLISLTYSFIFDKPILNQINEIFKLFNYIQKNHKKLNINIDNIMVCGDSAGGQLTLLAAAILQKEEIQEKFNIEKSNLKINCIGLIHGAYNLNIASKILKSKILNKLICTPEFLKCCYSKKYKKDEFYKYSAEPQYFVDSSIPPILIIASEADQLCLSSFVDLKEFLDKKGIKYDFHYEKDPKAVHVFNVLDPKLEISINANDKLESHFSAYII